MLEVEGDAALAPVGPETHVGAVPVAVVDGVHLDDVRPQIGEHPARERPRHPEPEVEDPHTLQRMGEGGVSAGCTIGRPDGGAAPCWLRLRHRLTAPVLPGPAPADRPGVAENSSTVPTWRMRPTSGSRTSATHPSARKASSASASAGERTAPRPSPTPRRPAPSRRRGTCGTLRPTGGAGTVRPGSRPLPSRPDRDRRGRGPSGPSVRLAFGRGEHPPADRPVVHPPTVTTLVEPLDRARVDGPHPVQGRVGVLHPLPVEATPPPAPPGAATSSRAGRHR